MARVGQQHHQHQDTRLGLVVLLYSDSVAFEGISNKKIILFSGRYILLYGEKEYFFATERKIFRSLEKDSSYKEIYYVSILCVKDEIPLKLKKYCV